MSVIITSADTMSKIADLIFRVVTWGYDQERFMFSQESENHIKSIWGSVECEREKRIYEALQKLNRNSYNTRYRKSNVEPFVNYPYEYKRFKRSESFHSGKNGPEDYQKLMNVKFLRYQCADHNNSPEAVKMYAVLDELVIKLMTVIIENTPEWKAAKWE